MPSPLTFKIFDQDIAGPREVAGYCSKRKDSLAIHKHDDKWFVVHKASGMHVNALVPQDVKSYPKLMSFMDFMEANAAPEFARLNELPFGPTAATRLNVMPELVRIRQVASDFNG